MQPQEEKEEEDLLQLLQPDELSDSPPVAYGRSVVATEDITAQVTIAATDADGDWLEYTIVSEPQHGFLSGSAPSFTYVPDNEYSGPDSFVFVALDSFGGRSAAATVSITVAGINDMPYAQDDSATTDYGTPVAIDVLANDWDIETEVLSIASTSSPQQQESMVTIAGSMITYTPGTGFSGTDCLIGGPGDDRMFGDRGQTGSRAATVTTGETTRKGSTRSRLRAHLAAFLMITCYPLRSCRSRHQNTLLSCSPLALPDPPPALQGRRPRL